MPETDLTQWSQKTAQVVDRLRALDPSVQAAWMPHVDLLACSEFLQRVLYTDADFARDPTTLDPAPYDGLMGLRDEAQYMSALRQRRRRELARIGWRDLLQLDPPDLVLRHISRLADQTIQCAVAWLEAQFHQRYGVPMDDHGRPMPLVVLGLGKLGGQELNYSSDIDLIFLYPSDGDIDHPLALEHGEFFTRMGQRFIYLLESLTEDGWVYRVDMRLRPFGESGPLAASFSFLENYFLEQGRDWERYAWIKARAIVGQEAYAELYQDVVRPFVYRRYLDFSVFESLRQMHERISREVERREWRDHLKLGPGGIREVEFTVQMFQLLRGGTNPLLQNPSLLSVLPKLIDPKMLSEAAVSDLLDAYRFLRQAENRIQMMDEQQKHSLPEGALERMALVKMLRLDSWESVQRHVERSRAVVSAHFKSCVFAHQTHSPDEGLERVSPNDARVGLAAQGRSELVMSEWHQPEDIAQWLRSMGVAATPEWLDALSELRHSRYFGRLSEEGRRRLQRLMPALVNHAAGQPPEVLLRLWRILEAIGHRLNYLSLLYENPQALKRLVLVCGLGDFLINQISQMPLLLDELIDDRLFEDLPTRATFARDLEWRLSEAIVDDENFVERIRDFQRIAIFRVALLDLTNRLPLMSVSDRLTEIAELVLERVLSYSWDRLVERYGEPKASAEAACRVAIIAYGKLAGREMGYGSDLDLVFVHNGQADSLETSGPQVIENSTFFVRLGQKIILLLTTLSRSGRLYEVDTRLRPSGRRGLLMTSLASFEDYQRQEAWTWEHQSLLHARAVAGDASVQRDFEDVRVRVLAEAVHRDRLKEDVVSMRLRMRKDLSKAAEGQFDMKQDPGGLADIEFIAQYLVLRHGAQYPPLLMYPDTIRQLESLASINLLAQRQVDCLVDAYRQYRRERHHRALESKPDVVEQLPWQQLRSRVLEVWSAVFE